MTHKADGTEADDGDLKLLVSLRNRSARVPRVVKVPRERTRRARGPSSAREHGRELGVREGLEGGDGGVEEVCACEGYVGGPLSRGKDCGFCDRGAIGSTVARRDNAVLFTGNHWRRVPRAFPPAR